MAMPFGEGSDPTLSEINVTPMVDVMLVLLIIFMVTTPLMQQGVEVDLPQTQAQNIKEDKQRIVVSIDKNQQLFIGKTPVTRDDFEVKLTHNEKIMRDKEVYLNADRTLPYGFVVDVMATLKRAGVEQVGMLTEPTVK